MELKLTPNHYLQLMKKAYSLDAIYLLKLIEKGIDILDLFDSVRVQHIYAGLLRKGLVTAQAELTLSGKDLLKFVDTPDETKLVKRRTPTKSEENFKEWWKAFPGTNTFTHKGKRFIGSRGLKSAKERCKLKYNEIINEGEYTPKQLLESLKFDVAQKKEQSFKTKTNLLSYLQNSLTYLNQRSYEPYIELIDEGATVEETNRAHDFDI